MSTFVPETRRREKNNALKNTRKMLLKNTDSNNRFYRCTPFTVCCQDSKTTAPNNSLFVFSLHQNDRHSGCPFFPRPSPRFPFLSSLTSSITLQVSHCPTRDHIVCQVSSDYAQITRPHVTRIRTAPYSRFVCLYPPKKISFSPFNRTQM